MATDATILGKNTLESEYNQLFCRNIRININNPFIIPILTTKRNGYRKICLRYPVNEIQTSNFPEGDNRYNEDNEDYGMNSTDLVQTCNDSLLTYFFDHDD